ncbi:MAG: hypothetical protein IPK17_08615 [Chloroflexi bacterium]|uniref:hypothetical protein n=1 Tax=Candidatus Flexifilum breve TaxID=3140694 RepID=UPI003135D1C2|nr:hypothetical protein [Chloroflexota bacterium]
MRKGLLLVMLLLTLVSGAALAQTTTADVYCGDLSADDCALLEQSQMAMHDLTAAAFNLFVDVQIEAEGEQMPISLVGSGAYSGLDRNADLSMDGMAALTALRGFNAGLMLTATLPQSMVEESERPTHSRWNCVWSTVSATSISIRCSRSSMTRSSRAGAVWISPG